VGRDLRGPLLARELLQQHGVIELAQFAAYQALVAARQMSLAEAPAGWA